MHTISDIFKEIEREFGKGLEAVEKMGQSYERLLYYENRIKDLDKQNDVSLGLYKVVSESLFNHEAAEIIRNDNANLSEKPVSLGMIFTHKMITEPSRIKPILDNNQSLSTHDILDSSSIEIFAGLISDLPINHDISYATIGCLTIAWFYLLDHQDHEISIIDRTLIISRMIISFNHAEDLMNYPFFWSEVSDYWLGKNKYHKTTIVKFVYEMINYFKEDKEKLNYARASTIRRDRTPEYLRIIIIIAIIILGILIVVKIFQGLIFMF